MSRMILAGFAGAVLLAAAPMSVEAGCGGGGYYGGGSYYGSNYSYSNSYYTPKVYYHTPVVHRNIVVHKPVVVHKPLVVSNHCSHPRHCYVWVQPGESLDAICLREYGNSTLWQYVAKYNNMGHAAALDCSRPLLLPSIYNSGRMVASTAPAPERIAVAPAVATTAAVPPAAPPIAQ